MLANRSTQIHNIINHYQFENVIHGPTRFGNGRNSLLDPILVRECSIGMSDILPVDRDISDHDGTFVEVIVNVKLNKTYKREVWSYGQADYQGLNDEF